MSELFFADRVRETCVDTGAGPLALAGAVPGYRAFADAVPQGAAFPYAIAGETRREQWETGTGSIDAGGRLVRAPATSSQGGAAVDFAPGLKTVALSVDAAWFASIGAASAPTMADIAGLDEALSAKEPAIAAATAGHYRRGDKSWQPLDRAAVGLANVDDTADAAKTVLAAAKLATPRTIAMTGDIDWSVSFDGSAAVSAAGTIAAGAVDNARLAGMANGTIKGRASAGAGAPEDLSAASARGLLGLVIGSDVQAYDSDLAALGSNAANGLWARTGAGSGAARAIVGTAGQIVVANGDGVAGNPALSLPATMTIANAFNVQGGVNAAVGLYAANGSSPQLAFGNAAGAKHWLIYETTGATGGQGALAFYDTIGAKGVLTLRPAAVEAGVELRPANDGVVALGGAANRWSQLYAASGTINTSDARDKKFVGAVPGAWLDAWGDVAWRRFKMRAAKGVRGGRRWHVGLIAQQVRDAFAARGIDACAIGLLCRDAVDARGGRGDRWGLRYDECQAIEAAWQRRQIARLAARIAAIEDAKNGTG